MMKALYWSIMWIVCISSAMGQPERIVQFPSEVSLGSVFIKDIRFADRWMDWHDIGPTRGEVCIQADKALRLDVSNTGSAHLAV